MADLTRFIDYNYEKLAKNEINTLESIGVLIKI